MSVLMEHEALAKTGAVERYFCDEMSDTERDQFEEHYFSCPLCAEEVRNTSLFFDNLKAVLKEPYMVPIAAAPAVPAIARMAAPRWWQSGAMSAVAASLLLVVGYQNLMQIPELRSKADIVDDVQAVPAAFLSQTRGADDSNVLRISAAAQHVILQITRPPAQSFSFLRCQLQTASGNGNVTLRSFVVAVEPTAEDWNLQLPAAGLSDGRYQLLIDGAADREQGTATRVGVYDFRIQR
jgi:hypothetical protein